MAAENSNGMQCNEFDALLSDALDQKLTGAELQSFQAHAHECAICGPLFSEAMAGKHWLKSLEDVEPPATLVRNILVATTGLDTARLHGEGAIRTQPTLLDRLRDWASGIASPVWAVARQPRFAMSFGMAFFSLSISLNLAGVKLSDIQRIDLRPSAIRRSYYETSGRVVKYYENIRFVYEIESRVQQFKRATTPAEPAPAEKEKDRKNNTSGQPEPRQDRNYSIEENQPMLAFAPNSPPVGMPVTTYRRIS
jgi:hypothetical protein